MACTQARCTSNSARYREAELYKARDACTPCPSSTIRKLSHLSPKFPPQSSLNRHDQVIAMDDLFVRQRPQDLR